MGLSSNICRSRVSNAILVLLHFIVGNKKNVYPIIFTHKLFLLVIIIIIYCYYDTNIIITIIWVTIFG